MTETRTKTLEERIEEAFYNVQELRRDLTRAETEMRDLEDGVKLDHEDEWAGAKNNDIRALLIAKWTRDDDEYQEARKNYRAAREEYRVSIFDLERLKLLVAVGFGVSR